MNLLSQNLLSIWTLRENSVKMMLSKYALKPVLYMRDKLYYKSKRKQTFKLRFQ